MHPSGTLAVSSCPMKQNDHQHRIAIVALCATFSLSAFAVAPPAQKPPVNSDEVPQKQSKPLAAPPASPGAPASGPKPAEVKPSETTPASPIDPKAAAIVKRGMEVAAAVRTISLVTQTRIRGAEGTNLGIGPSAPHEVVLEFVHKDAISLPRMRIAPVAAKGTLVFTHDGSVGARIDHSAKLYELEAGNWTRIAPFASGALPSWLVTERMAALAARRNAPNRELRPDMAAASILPSEKLDGEECDVVRITKFFEVFGGGAGDGDDRMTDARKVILEIAYARSDGFPRRIISRDEDLPQGQGIETEYTKVRVNSALDAGTFQTKPPDGYREVPSAARPTPSK